MSDGRIFFDWTDINSTAHLDELPLHRKIHWIFRGLTSPTCEGHRKWARFQLRRSNAIILAVLLPIAVTLLIFAIGFVPQKESESYIVHMRPDPKDDPVPDLDKITPPEDKPDPKSDDDAPGDELETAIISKLAQDDTKYERYLPEPITSQATSLESPVMPSISPKKFRALMPIGGPIGTRRIGIDTIGTSSPTESSVLLALRWLKKQQKEDGTWGRTKPAVTSLALLTYLAHAETPASPEFGTTVQKGIEWLLDNQTDDGRFRESDSHEYSLPIAAYALAEGYSMTQAPDLRYSAEKSVAIIVKGQHPDGGWDYNCKQSARNDTSYAGWCIQALKAASIARLEVDGLDQALKQAGKGLRSNYAGNQQYGGFGYTGREQDHGLTSVGVLCLQMLGDSDAVEVERGLRTLSMDKFKFDLMNPGCGKNGLYYWYYTTQAMFHAGGERWAKWDAAFSEQLVSRQKVMDADQSGYKDHENKPRAIGFWDQYEGQGSNEGNELPTVLCALQLEVYYRYLPSYKQQQAPAPVDDVPFTSDVKLTIVL